MRRTVPARVEHPAVTLVAWNDLAPAERAAVLRLEISPEQIEFAGTTRKSVAACDAGDRAEVAGLAIRTSDSRDIVGWVLLKRAAAAPDWVGPDTAVVSGLRIDMRHQGRGIGATALAEMARWVLQHWPGTKTLALRVDDGNVAGIRAYEKAGWVETGERRTGRVGVERTMSRRL
jgi:ribosomal protein S18 acetylase RimI-like enzyme